jgi:hypothetical protein
MADDTERHAAELFPDDHTSWRYSIEVKCGLALTPELLQARIAVLGDCKRRSREQPGSVLPVILQLTPHDRFAIGTVHLSRRLRYFSGGFCNTPSHSE